MKDVISMRDAKKKGQPVNGIPKVRSGQVLVTTYASGHNPEIESTLNFIGTLKLLAMGCNILAAAMEQVDVKKQEEGGKKKQEEEAGAAAKRECLGPRKYEEPKP